MIFRIDYNKIELGKLEKFYDTELKKKFPFQIGKPGFEGQLEVDFESGNAKHEKTNFIAWEFESKNKTKILHISKIPFSSIYTEYKNSDELFNDLNSIIKKFIESFQIQTINRIGLRYSNEIELSEKGPLDWQSYLQKRPSKSYKLFYEEKKRVARAIGQLIFIRKTLNSKNEYDLFSSSSFQTRKTSIKK